MANRKQPIQQENNAPFVSFNIIIEEENRVVSLTLRNTAISFVAQQPAGPNGIKRAPSLIVIIFNGQEMPFEKSLYNCGIVDGSNLRLVGREQRKIAKPIDRLNLRQMPW
jgi:hypothetical protein